MIGVNLPEPPKPRSAEAHLEGLGTVVMLKMRQRIIERLEETGTIFTQTSYDASTGTYRSFEMIAQAPLPDWLEGIDEEQIARDRANFADWMIRRMAENRLRDGKQMDSIIAASYKAFLPNLMVQALRTVKET
jgi:hypothetical protein